MSIDNFPQIDKKQQERWEKANLFASPKMPKGKKFYCLDMFPSIRRARACTLATRKDTPLPTFLFATN